MPETVGTLCGCGRLPPAVRVCGWIGDGLGTGLGRVWGQVWDGSGTGLGLSGVSRALYIFRFGLLGSVYSCLEPSGSLKLLRAIRGSL